MPLFVYVCYGLYLIYTGVYFYNRRHGKSAQFAVTRVSPEDSNEEKLIADLCVAISSFFVTGAVFYRQFFDDL